MTQRCSTTPVPSPDGRLMACFYPEEGVVVVPFESDKPVRKLVLPSTAGDVIHWTPDGRSVSYIDTREHVSNVWTQTLDGGPARQVTRFRSGQIRSFSWSRDSRKLVLSRTDVSSNVVLMKDFG